MFKTTKNDHYFITFMISLSESKNYVLSFNDCLLLLLLFQLKLWRKI